MVSLQDNMKLIRTAVCTALVVAGWLGYTARAPGGPLPANTAPQLGNLDGNSVTNREGGAATLLDAGSDATLTDVDSADFAGGNVTVSITTNRVDAEDQLGIRHIGTGPGEIGVSGIDVTFGGTIIGTFAGGTGSSPLVVSLNGNSTPAAVQALIRALTYTNLNSANPSTNGRQVTVSVDDGDGGTTSAVVTVELEAVNDAPTIAGPAGFITFAGMHLEITGVSFADVDAGNAMLSATFSAPIGSLTASNAGGVTVVGSGTALLGLTGTLAALNAFMAATNVLFVTPSDAAADFNLTVALNDGGASGTDPGLSGDSTSESATLDLPVQVLPVILSVTVPPNATYAAGQSLDFLVNVSEPVTVNTNGGVPRIALTVGASSVFAVLAGGGGSSVLTFRYAVQLADQDADGVVLGANLDLNGSVIQDSSSNNVPISLNNVPSTAGVLVNGMAPAAIADAYTMAEDSVLMGNVLTNDLSGSGAPLTAILVTSPTNGVVTLSTNGAFVYTPATNVHGIDVFTYKANDGTIDSSPGTVRITINNVNDPVQVGTALIDQVTVYGNTNFSYTIPSSAFTDIDGDVLTYTVTGLPAGVGFTQTNQTISGAPTAVGSNFVRVVASDGQFRATNTFTLTVNQATLVAVADDKTRVYGLTNPPLTITYIGFANSDTAARLTNPPIASTTATNNSPVGAYPINLTNGLDYRYSFVLSNGTLTIGKATVVATPISTSKAFGDPNPPLLINYLGLNNGETEAVLDVRPTINTTATQNSPPGSYPITLTGGSDGNYTLILGSGTLVVRPTGVPPASGSYYGLFSEVTGAQTNSSGAISVQTTAGTSFSAMLRMEGKSYRFSGTFDALGRFTNEIIRPGFFPITFELQIGSTNSPSQLSGRVMLSGGGWESPLLAVRAPYRSTTNPAPQVGRYSIFWPGGTNVFQDQPYGHSHASLKVSSNGKVQFQGQMGDTSTATESMVLTEGGLLPLYVPVRGRDALFAWLSFTNLTNQDIAGSLTWTVWPAATRVLYPNGFRVDKPVYGALYVPPAGTNRIIDLPSGNFISSVGDVFIIPGLIQDKITNSVLLSTKHRLLTTNGVALPVHIRRDTGLFSGYIQDPVLGGIYRFSGSFIQKTNVGLGFHTGRLSSGRVEYVPAP